MLYTHLPYHNDSIIVKTDTHRKTHEERKQEGRHRKTFLQIYLLLTLFVRFACERVLETEHKLHILTSTTYDRHVVSFLFSWMLNLRSWGPLLDAGFLYCILSASSLDPSSSGLRAPSAWCGFPYHISSLTLWKSAGNCFGTQLNSII